WPASMLTTSENCTTSYMALETRPVGETAVILGSCWVSPPSAGGAGGGWPGEVPGGKTYAVGGTISFSRCFTGASTMFFEAELVSRIALHTSCWIHSANCAYQMSTVAGVLLPITFGFITSASGATYTRFSVATFSFISSG